MVPTSEPEAMNLQMTRGDSETFALPTSVDCTAAIQLILTAKFSTQDPDTSAVFQRILGTGLTVTSSTIVTATLVPKDTSALTVKSKLVWDLQAQFSAENVITVAKGTLVVEEDVTQLLTASVPVNPNVGDFSSTDFSSSDFST